MSRFIHYFLRGMNHGAIAQVDFETNNLYTDTINISNDFQVAKRNVVGRETVNGTRTTGNSKISRVNKTKHK